MFGHFDSLLFLIKKLAYELYILITIAFSNKKN